MTSATSRKPSPQHQLESAARAIERGRLEVAKRHCEAVLAAAPENPDALHLLGLIAYRHEQFPLAVRLVSEALARRVHFPAALSNLGGVLLRMREWTPAQEALEAALRQRPGDAAALTNLGTVYLELGEIERAKACFDDVLRIAPERPVVWNNLGNLHRDRGEWAEAERCYREAIRLDRGYADPRKSLGSVLLKSGRLAESESAFRDALDMDPGNVEALSGLANAKQFDSQDPDLGRFSQVAEAVSNWTPDRRARFFFSWGKALDDAGRYDDAFTCFVNGNEVRAAERPCEASVFGDLVDQLLAGFPRRRMADLRGGGQDDDSPIFVLGMPRSGTTLTERILSSHSRVHGAGELKALSQAVAAATGEPLHETYPSWLGKLDTEAVLAVAERYLEFRPVAPSGRIRVTDKMPSNFVHLGLIRLAFPNARIFHCVRDPLDVCLSCFQRDFGEGQNFSFRLDALAQRFRDYARLMEFWRAVFPGQWMDVPYEALVADPQTWSRAIVHHAGLPWEDACLEHHRSRGMVLTASAWQVRQPVYRDSVRRWQRYAEHLQALRDAIGEYADWHERFPQPPALA